MPENHFLTKFTTQSTITISNLHPYVLYSAQVIVHNSRHFSTIAETTFNTAQSGMCTLHCLLELSLMYISLSPKEIKINGFIEVPSEVFSQLRVQDWKLLWQPPEDCTTITGLLKARVKIHGISDAVKYFYLPKQTISYYLDLSQLNPKLNGVERYMARVYVIRDYNSKENDSAYLEYQFETPPKGKTSYIVNNNYFDNFLVTDEFFSMIIMN